MALIEILPGVYYDTEKDWWKQPQTLIYLAESVMSQEPKAFENETYEDHYRHIWATWEHTTELGTFEMKQEPYYLNPIQSKGFLAYEQSPKITVSQIS